MNPAVRASCSVTKNSTSLGGIESSRSKFVETIRAAKPVGVKGNYIKSITLAGTMTPGVPVTV